MDFPYNKAERAHKLMVEELESLKWKGFIHWMKNRNLLDFNLKFGVTSKLEGLSSEPQNSSKYLSEHKGHVHDLAEGLATLLTEMKPLFD